MLHWITKERKWIFAAGAAVGAVVVSFLSTKKAHDLAVKGVANSMLLKDKVLENVVNIKEQADDICTEAKMAAKNECVCGEDCDCTNE